MAFNNTPWLDRRGASRTVPMKVLVLGFCRTGTASMRKALETLGYNDTHHMQAVLVNPLEVDMWTEAVKAKFSGVGKPYGREEWDELLGHCQAVTDLPAIMFSEELIAAYPDAKVILTNRDPEKWWKSYSEALQPIWRSRKVAFAAWLDPEHLGKVFAFSRLTVSTFLGSATNADKEDAKRRMVAHYEKVRKLVPKERLLEYEVGGGWNPLCAFLGNEVPDTEFPRVNDTKAIRQAINMWAGGIIRGATLRFVVPTVALVSACIAVYVQKFRV
ncbi:P-loop containing nucleoside triphosphate hydrolase protein [Mycena crocata]|nr:P-loop containing nucleoside triphosphate hydrolase protein [Mycena crocata]